jgi:hypothetical protein
MNHQTPPNFLDLTGQVFGRLTVVARGEKRAHGRVYWKCECVCGGKKEVVSSCLRNGQTQSCGCFHREVTSKNNSVDLTGQKFGRLLVIERQGYTEWKDTTNNGVPTRYRQIKWSCKCDCGKEVSVVAASLTSGSTKSCGCLRLSVSAARFRDRIVHPDYEPNRKKAMVRQVSKRLLCISRKRKDSNLTLQDIEVLVLDKCFYCGASGRNKCRDKNGSKQLPAVVLEYNGIDRIDSNRGYTKENSVTCCYRCNLAKNDMSQSEFFDLISAIHNKHLSDVSTDSSYVI